MTNAVGNLSVDQLYPLYAAVGKARQSSPALQSANRVFLSPTSVAARYLCGCQVCSHQRLSQFQ